MATRIAVRTLAFGSRPILAAFVLRAALAAPVFGQTPGPEHPVLAGQWRCHEACGVACGQDLGSVQMLATDSGWAVGSAGTILHYDGNAWIPQPSPVSERLNDVHMVSAGEGWAVGGRDGNGSCAIVHYRDGAWTNVGCPPSAGESTLYAVAMTDSGTGWAAGRGHGGAKLLLRYSDDYWAPEDAPDFTVLDIALQSSSDGWAVGHDGETPDGDVAVLRLEAGVWRKQVLHIGSPGVASLTKVDMVDDDSGWAFGALSRSSGAGAPTKDGLALQRVEGGWRPHVVPGVSFASGVSVTGSECWAIATTDAGQALYHFENAAWSSEPIGSVSSNIVDIDSVDAEVLWLVGESSSLLVRDHDAWETVSHSEISRLSAVAAVSATEAWATARDHIVHFRGRQWDMTDPYSGTALSSISVAGENVGWAVGPRSGMFRLSGGSWVAEQPPSRDLRAVHVASEHVALAVGGGGEIVRLVGGRWRSEGLGSPDYTFRSVFAHDSGEAWAVGHRRIDGEWGCAIVRHRDGQWSDVECPTQHTPYGVAMNRSGTGWAVGTAGTILRYDGERWRVAESPTGEHLFGIALYGEDRGWAVGNAGTLLRIWDGHWSIERTPTRATLLDVATDPSGRAWAVGWGAVVEFTPRSPVSVYLPLATAGVGNEPLR